MRSPEARREQKTQVCGIVSAWLRWWHSCSGGQGVGDPERNCHSDGQQGGRGTGTHHAKVRPRARHCSPLNSCRPWRCEWLVGVPALLIALKIALRTGSTRCWRLRPTWCARLTRFIRRIGASLVTGDQAGGHALNAMLCRVYFSAAPSFGANSAAGLP
jgi:hypothetical protein